MKSTGHALFGVSHSLPVLKIKSYFGGIPGNYNQSKPPRLVVTQPLIMVYLNVSPSLLKRPYIESVCLFFALRKGSILIGKTLDCSCLLPPWLGIYLLLCKKHPGQSRHPCSGLVHIKLWDSYQAMSRGAPHRKPWLAYIAKAFRYLLAELQNSSPINRDIRISFWILTRLLKLCMYLYIYMSTRKTGIVLSHPPTSKTCFFWKCWMEVSHGIRNGYP